MLLAGASFVRSAAGVHEIRDYLSECLMAAAEKDPSRIGEPLPLIISKIESTEALEELPAIVAASDGITRQRWQVPLLKEKCEHSTLLRQACRMGGDGHALFHLS